MLGTVKNIGLGALGVIVLDQGFFNNILNFFNMLQITRLKLLAHFFGDKKQVSGRHVFTANSLIGLGDGIENFDRIKRHFRAVALCNAGEHV